MTRNLKACSEFRTVVSYKVPVFLKFPFLQVLLSETCLFMYMYFTFESASSAPKEIGFGTLFPVYIYDGFLDTCWFVIVLNAEQSNTFAQSCLCVEAFDAPSSKAELYSNEGIPVG